MAKVGRPSIYSKKLADKICEILAQGISLRTVCKMEGMPVGATVFRWMRTREGFREQYMQAKEESADAMSEDVLAIADGASDKIVGGEDRADNARVQVEKLRVDTRKWLMSKMKPKKYGEKMDMTSGGEPLAQIVGMRISRDDEKKK